MKDLDTVFANLGKSRFRSSFKLKGKELEYLRSKGIDTVLEHGRDFIDTRLAPANPPNDGKQTPMKNHPVFIAQHATATCCRGCLQKWHGIRAKDHELNVKEKEYVLELIKRWIKQSSCRTS